jgi:hypothetical protein
MYDSAPFCDECRMASTHTALTCLFRSSEWLAAWRPETGRLFLPAHPRLRLRETVAVKVEFADRPVGATVVGTVVSILRHVEPFRIEVAPDEESLRAVGLLTAAARGQPVRFRSRPPRHRIRLPVVVSYAGAGILVNTISASEAGCSLRWPGRLPAVGQRLFLRFGVGIRSVDVVGVVRWKRPSPSSPAVGLQLEADGSTARGWTALLAEAVRTGTPEA